jgi:sporulation protein YlmC with PRC-barrel domain
MKKLLMGIGAVVVATSLVGGAQASPSNQPAAKKDTAKERKAFKAEGTVHESSDIIGTRIKDAQGKNIGEVDRLLIDPESGRVTHAVIGLGGVLGVGEEKVVVPWSDLRMTAARDGRKAEITLDQAKLQSAPRYERTARGDRAPAASPATTRESDKTRTRDMDKSDSKK